MLITYLRSSSYAQWDYCQMQYFINYVLGWTPDSNHKANKGTTVHAVMERLAKIKLAIQNGKSSISDDILGEFSFVEKDMYTESRLTDTEVDAVNRSRINKNVYLCPCSIEYGHVRRGREIVNEVFVKVFEYYKNNTTTDWAPVDMKDCLNWVWMILEYRDGLYDPRKRRIFDVERKFDIEIEHDWAKIGNDGRLGIKGTIDLLLQDEEGGMIEAVDWKTGQRLNWATMQEKNYKDFTEDTQLMLYFYALSKSIGVEGIMSTIFYVRHGGPYSVVFDGSTVPKIESRLRARFEEIKACEDPKLFDPSRKHFKCKTLCHYYKNKFDGSQKSICSFIERELDRIGMDAVVEKYSREGHSVDHYQAPGDV